MTTRDYDGDGIRVHWDSSRCIHTAICLRTLPAVFDTSARPWVDTSGASANEIASTVERCPSGALSYSRTDGSPGEVPPDETVVVPIQNGPLAVRGRVTVTTRDGTTIHEHSRMTLCRCGASANQPFCDSSHREIEFESREPGAPEPGEAENPDQVCPVQIAPFS